MKISLQPYNDQFRSQVINIWERSVRATHGFIQPADIEFYKAIVSNIDFNSLQVYCAFSEINEMVGFIGVADNKVEMLFLEPHYIGKGIGKKFVRFAIEDLHATEVDVNEQNENAVEFYKRLGFVTYDRAEVDATSKPYPILKMRLAIN